MVKIAPFGVESWLNKWEKSATYDILSEYDRIPEHARPAQPGR